MNFLLRASDVSSPKGSKLYVGQLEKLLEKEI
jgi:hypothetical protein